MLGVGYAKRHVPRRFRANDCFGCSSDCAGDCEQPKTTAGALKFLQDMLARGPAEGMPWPGFARASKVTKVFNGNCLMTLSLADQDRSGASDCGAGSDVDECTAIRGRDRGRGAAL